MSNYKYQTRHPDSKAHGGTAIIVNAKIKHYVGNSYSEKHIQATIIAIKLLRPYYSSGSILPPKYKITIFALFSSTGESIHSRR